MDMDTIIRLPASTQSWVLRSNHQEDIELQGELIVGRDPECDICIPDHRISRKHAKIKITFEGLIVEDLNSRNGTTVNDLKITAPTLCQSGDKLKFHNMPFIAEVLPPQKNEVLVMRAANYPDLKLQGQLVVGRDSGCDVCIDDELISRKHATISCSKLGVMVEDLGSINGTFVNDHRIASATRLKAGDSVRFHTNTFSIEEESDPDATFICVGDADPDATVCAGAIVNNISSNKPVVKDREIPEPDNKPSTQASRNLQPSAIQRQVSQNVTKLNKPLGQLDVGVWVELSNYKDLQGTYCLFSKGNGTDSRYSFISRNGTKLVKKSRSEIKFELNKKMLKILDKKPFLSTKLTVFKGKIVGALKKD